MMRQHLPALLILSGIAAVGVASTRAVHGIGTAAGIAADASGSLPIQTGNQIAGSFADATGTGLAALYPGDAGIENHPDVIFVERFEQPTLADLFNRWTDVLNPAAMLFTSDVPPGSPGSRSLNIPWVGGGVNNGGHLYKQLSPGVDDTLYVRYYIKYPTNGKYHHTGIWMGGNNPPLSWPNPQAGIKPVGNDRFIAGAEQNTLTTGFDHYDYWMNMRQAADGMFWGNFLLNNPSVDAKAGQWTCVEHMVKLNNPTTAFNGEHAIWLDGVKVSHLGQGFPNGNWSGGIFTQDPTGTPFEGFRWRSSTSLNLNWIWLQNYSPDDPAGFTGNMYFDHVVVAKSYIGCLASGSSDVTPPTVSGSAPAAGSTVSGSAVTVSATAADNVGVTGVQFKLDGADLGAQDTAIPFSISWNSTTAPNGLHTLTALARDAAGNTTTSAGVMVTVSNPPPVPAQLTSPTPGSNLVSGSQMFTWNAGTGVSSYKLGVGTTVGGTNIYAGIAGTALSAQVAGLPTNGALVWVRLQSMIAGAWQYVDYPFKAFTSAPGMGVRADKADFDRDGKADLALYRPSTGYWYINQSSTNYATYLAYQWGVSTDIAVPGDHDGDGLVDLVLYRPSTGMWYMLLSTTQYSTYIAQQWGVPTDIPVPGDYEGDGKNDLALYRPSTGYWYIKLSSTNYTTSLAYQWGMSTDVTVPGDYDGDGKTDLALYRASSGIWYVLQSSTNFTTYLAQGWGAASDIAIPGDYDGDGKTDLALYRPSTGMWSVKQSSTNYLTNASYQWGLSTDLVVRGDFDGDKRADLGLYRPSTGYWYVRTSTTNYTSYFAQPWGLSTDIPVFKRP